jgi:UCH-binding domain
LSSILENLGMPQTSNSGTSTATTGMDPPAGGTAETSATTARNQLTLADLQGAMAMVQQQQQQQPVTVGPPLQDLITTQSIDAIMNSPEACERLLQYLPAEQQSMEYLRDNLSSSSLQSTLRTLTQMLVQQPDDAGVNTDAMHAYTEYSNIIANFQLDPSDGQTALLQHNNPIEAFLNCIIASVEKEKTTSETAIVEDSIMQDEDSGSMEVNTDEDMKDGNDNDGDVVMKDDKTSD